MSTSVAVTSEREEESDKKSMDSTLVNSSETREGGENYEKRPSRYNVHSERE